MPGQPARAGGRNRSPPGKGWSPRTDGPKARTPNPPGMGWDLRASQPKLRRNPRLSRQEAVLPNELNRDGGRTPDLWGGGRLHHTDLLEPEEGSWPLPTGCGVTMWVSWSRGWDPGPSLWGAESLHHLAPARERTLDHLGTRCFLCTSCMGSPSRERSCQVYWLETELASQTLMEVGWIERQPTDTKGGTPFLSDGVWHHCTRQPDLTPWAHWAGGRVITSGGPCRGWDFGPSWQVAVVSTQIGQSQRWQPRPSWLGLGSLSWTASAGGKTLVPTGRCGSQ